MVRCSWYIHFINSSLLYRVLFEVFVSRCLYNVINTQYPVFQFPVFPCNANVTAGIDQITIMKYICVTQLNVLLTQYHFLVPCQPNWNVNLTAGIGKFIVSWTPLPGVDTYLVFYNSTKSMKKELRIVINSSSIILDYLELKVVYMVQVIGFDSLTIKPKVYSCPRSAEIKKCKSTLGPYS